jgi:hypothetical protein
MFRQNAMAPVADTPNNLNTARSIRGPRVKLVTRLIRMSSVPVRAMETLPKVATNMMPHHTVWVACDCLVWSSFNIMREGKPFVAT